MCDSGWDELNTTFRLKMSQPTSPRNLFNLLRLVVRCHSGLLSVPKNREPMFFQHCPSVRHLQVG